MFKKLKELIKNAKFFLYKKYGIVSIAPNYEIEQEPSEPEFKRQYVYSELSKSEVDAIVEKMYYQTFRQRQGYGKK